MPGTQLVYDTATYKTSTLPITIPGTHDTTVVAVAAPLFPRSPRSVVCGAADQLQNRGDHALSPSLSVQGLQPPLAQDLWSYDYAHE